MPPKYAYKKKTSKYSRYSKPKAKIPRNVLSGPFPLEQTVKMRYCQTVQLDAFNTATDHILFRANSIFDPFEPIGGHQPYGHDQWSAVYNHYLVTNSYCSVTAIPELSTASTIGIVGIAVKDDTSVETQFDTIREATNSKWVYAIAQKNNTVRNSFSNAKMFRNLQDNSVKALFGTNPAEQAYFQIYATGVDVVANPSPVNCIVTIDYTVKMWELKDLAQS